MWGHTHLGCFKNLLGRPLPPPSPPFSFPFQLKIRHWKEEWWMGWAASAAAAEGHSLASLQKYILVVGGLQKRWIKKAIGEAVMYSPFLGQLSRLYPSSATALPPNDIRHLDFTGDGVRLAIIYDYLPVNWCIDDWVVQDILGWVLLLPSLDSWAKERSEGNGTVSG